ncbi:haloacid dehalogenase [Pseudoalteromonas luteoviolacea]|uniref:Haloacid dehalogenase n=1 Tax=Pseudoalteromonas luteoviolacea TaxID=43657 RepID=A0A1C0TVD6_9GAMM|nr:HAD-IA family hydrolase [Pseudoalteromonas luteoviolacea]MBQ4809830.1 HAD-IA family hydrolase [Pseudoalteromonas luteoviolacea]OCQ23275.1 haloacid dehalogenase [Pseudoalteromonas luteoviolacea]
MTKAVIFDLDGTLLNTSEDLGSALNQVLRKHNRPIVSKKDYSPAISNGVKALLEVGFGEELNRYDVESLRQQVLDSYEKNIAVHSFCFDGIAELLQKLESLDIAVGIMTNKPEFLTKPLLKQIPDLCHIEAVVCGDTLKVAKPHPEPLLLVAKQLGVDPQQCIYVGDAQRDIEAAHAAQMRSVSALWGFIPSLEEAISWGAELNLSHPVEIISHI